MMLRAGLIACALVVGVAEATAAPLVVTSTAARMDMPPPGTYWVRRLVRLGGTRSSGFLAGEVPVVERSGHTACGPLRVDERELTLGLDRGAALTLRRGSGASAALSRELAHRRGRLDGTCRPTGGLAAPTVPDRASCEAAPSTYHQTCRAAVCTWEDARAQPYTWAGCEAEVEVLRRRAALIEDADHASVRRTLAALERTLGAGGTLHERDDDRCVAVAVKRVRRADATEPDAQLTRVDRRDGLTTTTRETYRLEPLFGRATRGEMQTEVRAASGESRGGGASSGWWTVPLLLGDGVIVLGERTLYVRARDCASAPLPAP